METGSQRYVGQHAPTEFQPECYEWQHSRRRRKSRTGSRKKLGRFIQAWWPFSPRDCSCETCPLASSLEKTACSISSSPIGLAILTFIIISNFVGCSTGRLEVPRTYLDCSRLQRVDPSSKLPPCQLVYSLYVKLRMGN